MHWLVYSDIILFFGSSVCPHLRCPYDFDSKHTTFKGHLQVNISNVKAVFRLIFYKSCQNQAKICFFWGGGNLRYWYDSALVLWSQKRHILAWIHVFSCVLSMCRHLYGLHNFCIQLNLSVLQSHMSYRVNRHTEVRDFKYEGKFPLHTCHVIWSMHNGCKCTDSYKQQRPS